MVPLFGPVPEAAVSLFVSMLGVVALVVQLVIAYRWVRALARAPAAFREGLSDVSRDDVAGLLRYALPVLGAQLLVVAILWPGTVASVSQVAVVAVVLIVLNLVGVAALAIGYLAVRNFLAGYRASRS
ncbi:hypothetical protein BRC82_06400 [Halobacteriales archaeon QS_1_67_19]|nr:MAG: hypothetical protein BRC82_06400 [Halobacteriales archaeon QS_1_67_19]